ncbi:hypothetical protein LSG25_01520 [Paralcaligenes sp. KSB-10]|jgi:hypothetical protein|uniref:hypothetical protein n=1 Tax=Paralcaligenes sp. KSB-10 TaxID=2901142 RepID=UPI001E4F9433|nr:hypothetical protein [Paralcaligenes sp. KSB-10]UHL64613.1 hypothetical protein LSG25_01520 [Paralcaligenes sp. KSB-10]
MQKTRTHLAVIAIAASLGLLAACSKSEDAKPADTTSGTVAPAPAPSSSSPSSSAPAPSSSSAGDAAKEAAGKVADKAGELKDSAVEKAGQMGDAIKKGAAEADKAIQDKVGNGTATPNPASPPPPSK